jgi:SAM-dependent methyltransferase
VTPWDAGGVPPDWKAFVETLPSQARILIPGCGSGYEVYDLARRSFDVTAIDFSSSAIEAAQAQLGVFADRVRLADFFSFDPHGKFDVVYERAFLCALPRKMWGAYALRMTELVQPGGRLAGFFFYANNPKGPPFGTSAAELHSLLDAGFELVEDRAARESLPVFGDGERWQVWSRQD